MSPEKEQKNNSEKPSGLQTFQHDVAEAMKEGKGSIIKIAVAEQERKDREAEILSPKSPMNKRYIFAGLMLLLVALGAIGVIAYLKGGKVSTNNSTPVENKIPSAIRADAHVPINITNETPSSLRTKIADILIKTGATNGTITDFYFTKDTDPNTLVGSADFLNMLGSTMPNSLLRSLGQKFMIGTYQISNTSVPFIVLTTDSFQSTFAGMLLWEKTMIDDLYQILNIPIQNENQILFTNPFNDGTIKNKDARILRDAGGRPALMYLFLDNNTILITSSSASIDEISTRLFEATIKK